MAKTKIDSNFSTIQVQASRVNPGTGYVNCSTVELIRDQLNDIAGKTGMLHSTVVLAALIQGLHAMGHTPSLDESNEISHESIVKAIKGVGVDT